MLPQALNASQWQLTLGWSTWIAWTLWLYCIIMYNTRHLPPDEILCAFGDTDNFRLEQLIEPELSEEEINILKPSEYYSIETLPIQLKNLNNFNILSLNAQSINAKFDCLLALIEVAKTSRYYVPCNLYSRKLVIRKCGFIVATNRGFHMLLSR